jgi:hypothetical protein
VEILLPRAC